MDKMTPPLTPLGQQIETLVSQSNLTAGQLLLWLGQKLNPEVPLYNMVFSFTLQGEIAPVHFQSAFQTLVNGSDSLRLRITELNGVPTQQVQPMVDYRLPLLDFSTDIEPHKTAQAWLSERCTRSLPLEKCLFDSALIKLASDQFIWYINQHHLITDNWSVSLLYRQLQAYYGRSLNGPLTAEIPGLSSYLAYAESEQPASPWRQQAITHWQQKQANSPPPVALYGQTSDLVSTHTERTYCELGQERSKALRALARTPEARSLSIHQSQFNLFLTLLYAYLYRVSGSRELAIAAPAHNRPTPVLKETPGVLMELFPLQIEIDSEETFTSLLTKVAKESMAFLRYAQSGISHHGMTRGVNVVLSYINVTFPAFHGIPVHTDWIHAGHGDSQHHLRLEVHDFDATGNFTLQFDFNYDLIPDAQRQWAAEHFCKLLDAWLEDGQQPIETVDILAEAERALILEAEYSSYGQLSPVNDVQTLVDSFQQHVHQVPDQAAVVFKHKRLTYGELERQSNQLAHYLIRQGIHKGMVVGLFMERSVSMVVSLLAILKSGAVYLPIDPAYPPERTTLMVEDAQVSVLLTQQALMDQCPKGEARGEVKGQVICLDVHQAAIAQAPTEAPEVELAAQDLAYILFTSGSTGQPKGIMVTHRNVLAMVQGFEQTAPMGDQRRGTALCSYGFDVSIWELFSNLCFGGTVYLVPADVVTSHDRFAHYLITHGITSAYIPPALLSTVIDTLEKEGDARGLDRILVGVEPIQQALLQRYLACIPQLRIVNGYGPTETTICATFHRFDTVTDLQGIVPIGKAAPGYVVYLVNPQGQRVPVGVKGELLIGGAGLSRGYLNRPELMAERFIQNPLGTGQLFKTHDQARYLPDGSLEFLGRLDQQVKIRGFRVELSEVELALGQYPPIQQAAVITQAVNHGNRVLVAYLVAPECVLNTRELRDFLRQTLPDYMVPNTFIVLDALPQTPNGKVDRRRLASAEYSQQEPLRTATDYAAPESEWETYLANVWARCLRVESVGIHDNFFDLGGDSITAIQISAQATAAGLALSPQTILQHLTVARVLAHIHPVHVLADGQGQSMEPVPLTPVQRMFFAQNLVDPHHWNQSLLLDVAQPLEAESLATALKRLVQHHPVLRFQFTLTAGGWQQRPAATETATLLQAIDLSHQRVAEQDRAMAEVETELQTSLNLETGHLVQAALFSLGDNRPHRLLLIIHHLVVDGVSWLTLLTDLETFYRQAQGEAVAQPLPTMSFQTWATGLVTTVTSGTFQSELAHWLQPSQGAINPLSQDIALGSTDNTVASTQVITTCLAVDETNDLLKEMPKRARAQVNEILLTALALALGAETDPLCLDLEGHGREETLVPGANLVRTVGWFTTVFPLGLSLPPTDVEGQLQAVKEQVRAIPRNGIGYGLLRYLRDDPEAMAQWNSLPQSDILFNYLGDLAGLVPTDSMFHLARELRLSRSPRGQRRYLLEVNAAVVQGQLHVDWSYSQNVHRQEMVQGWADALMQGLRLQLHHYLSPQSNPEAAYSPVDFPLADLTGQTLDKIAALLNKTDSGG